MVMSAHRLNFDHVGVAGLIQRQSGADYNPIVRRKKTYVLSGFHGIFKQLVPVTG